MKVKDIGPIEHLVAKKGTGNNPALEMLYLDVQNKRLVACNGGALIVIAVEPEEGDVSGLISPEALRHARATAKGTFSNLARFQCRETELIVEDVTEGKKTIYRRPMGRYPEWSNIFPHDVEETPVLTINPALLSQLVAAFPQDELGRGAVRSVSFFLPKDYKAHDKRPILVKACHEGALAMFMPVQFDGNPKWNVKLPGAVVIKGETVSTKVESAAPAKKKPRTSKTAHLNGKATGELAENVA